MKLNGKPEWQTILEEIENHMKKMKKNDGSSSAQSIGLDEEDEGNGGANMQPTVPKRNRRVIGNKWEKERVAREGAANKISAIWTGIFFAKEVKE